MAELAICGGDPTIKKPFRPYNSIGEEEAAAVQKVMKSGTLSQFLGVWGADFNGGPTVREFEQVWSRAFGVRHSISVNSATSALFAAIGAAGVSPGDEVVVPPYTMSATVMAPLVYGAIPVFADVEPETFCIDPQSVLNQITEKTKAIIAVNLFGHPAKLHQLREIADRKGLLLIEDNSQGPRAAENGRFAGTIGHIGVFSLNYHKHIHTGEGGILTTNDDHLALRLQLIRNHGENAIEPAEITDLSNMIGFNYRLTELAAAIGIEQLKKLDALIDERERVANQLTEELNGIPGFVTPAVRKGCRHVYYVWSAKMIEAEAGISRALFNRALTAEGFPAPGPYVKPLYLLPTFQQRIALGKHGFPFTLTNRSYEKGLCPVTERLYEKEMLVFPLCSYALSSDDISQIAHAVRKIFKNRAELNKLESKPLRAVVART
jgi:perosamine synthetase